ncbi:MAG: nucleotidyltransferase domain-containing protein [Verrucomicrobiota bacterium]|nr:nucleotidyltransferase domain-containing protein [Verrucomicrobiota bacterium]
MTNLLQKRAARRKRERLELFDSTRAALRVALRELVPGERTILFGSLTQRGTFNAASDIDLALEREPRGLTRGELMVALGERLERRVDLVLLRECRFAAKIRREGEMWTR